MSGSVMTDRQQPYHMLSAGSSMAEYACADCGRTFRRHATYRRHRLQSHDDVIQATGKHLQLVTSLSDRSPCSGVAVSCGRSVVPATFGQRMNEFSDVEMETETVDNCCVDDEICLDENSSCANGLPFRSDEETNATIIMGKARQAIKKQLAPVDLACRNNATVERKIGSVAVSKEAGNVICTVKVEQTDDASLDCDEELADFRTPAEASLQHGRPMSALAKTETELAKNLAQVTSSCGVRSTVTEQTSPVRQRASVACKQEIDCDQANNGRQIKDEELDENPRTMKASSAVTSAVTGGASAATVVTTNATQKIYVYVKTESQVPFGNATAAVVANNCPNGLMTMMSDEQLVQPLLTTAKPTGCQFVCPICQRLFNSEKYLSMHISSIHRTDGLQPQQQQQQQQQQNTKQIATIEVVSAPKVSPPSTVVTSVTTARRTHNAPRAVAAVPVSAPAANSPQHHTSASAAALSLPSVISVPASAVTVSLPASTTAATGGGSVVGPTRTSTQWTCNICNKSFAQNSSYKNHIRTHSDDRPYVCSICSIGFKERYHLKKHALFKHTTELNETCRVCGKRFKDSTAVRAHERIHSDVRPYGCTLCGKTFKTSECLWHHENRSKTCGKMAVAAAAAAAAAVSSGTVIGVDGRAAVRRQNVQQQQQPQQQPQSGRMASAGTKRQRRNPLSVTAAAARQLPNVQPSAAIDEVQSAVAIIASEQLTDAASIDAQMTATVSALTAVTPVVKSCLPAGRGGNVAPVDGKLQQQPIVEKTTQPLSAVTSTLDDVDNSFCSVPTKGDSVTLATTPSADSMDCELFNDVKLSSMFDEDVASSTLVDEFWQHFDMDQMTSDYCCDIDATDPDVVDSASSTTETASSSSETTNDDSEASTAAVDELTKEIAMTAAQFSFASSVESSPVDGSSTPTVGRMSNAGSGKRHDCARCDKRFASAATLEKHLLVHAEVRPYRCSVCDIGFKLKVHLKKHNLYRHSDDYPCECSVCGKRFKDSSAVRLHERIHSADRPFQCLHCGKSFKTKENLWGHRNRGPCDKSSSNTSMVAAPFGATGESLMTSPHSSSSPPPADSVLLETAASSSMAANDVTQHFVANNVRLFHSAEFGPILGVPVNARLVFREVIEGAADKTAAPEVFQNSTSAGMPASSNGQVMVPSSASLSAGLPRLTATVAGPQDGGSPKPGQPPRVVVMSAAATATVSSSMLTAVPTAVVAPIKRQTASAVSPDGLMTSLAVQNRPTSLLLPSTVRLVTTSANQNATVVGGRRLVATSTCQQQQSAISRKRSNSASVADRCPTVQKYLALGTTDRDGSAPVEGGLFPASIQKLFQLLVPDTTAITAVSSASVQISRAAPAAATQTTTAVDYNGLLDDGANDVASTVMLADGVVAASHKNGVASVCNENASALDVVDWSSTTMDVSSVANGQLEVAMDNNWNKLTKSLADVKDRQPFDGCLLSETAEDEQLSDVNDYTLVLDPSTNIARSVAHRNAVNVDHLICDEDEGSRLLDPFNCALNDDSYETSAVGSSDTMWCGGQSSWTPDNDLGGLLIFGPN